MGWFNKDDGGRVDGIFEDKIDACSASAIFGCIAAAKALGVATLRFFVAATLGRSAVLRKLGTASTVGAKLIDRI